MEVVNFGGNSHLTISGVPKTPDSLFISAILQLQRIQSDFRQTPNEQLHQLKFRVWQILSNQGSNAISCSSSDLSSRLANYHHLEIIPALRTALQVDIEIYSVGHPKRTYPSYFPNRPHLQLYYQEPFYDSIQAVYDNEESALARSCNQPQRKCYKIGTMNLRGMTSIEKQLIIDDLSHKRGIDILFVQETHLYAQNLKTFNYDWVLGPQTAGRASRGCGFAISKQFSPLSHFHVYSPNICELEVISPEHDKRLFLLCVHKLSDNDPLSALETGYITSIVRRLREKGDVLIGGDFNSHIGQQDVAAGHRLFGSYLFHDRSNYNGHELIYMCELMDLQVLTTKAHRSTKVTWSSGSRKSQIDHVLQPVDASYTVSTMRGHWTKFSDHKLITFKLYVTSKPVEVTQGFKLSFNKSLWDISLFTRPKVKEKYENLFSDGLNCLINTSENISDRWDKVCVLACQVADKTVKPRKKSSDPEISVAYGELKRQLSLASRERIIDREADYDDDSDHPPSSLPGVMSDIYAARKRYETVRHQSRLRKLNNLLEIMESEIVREGERVQLAFKFIRSSRRASCFTSSRINLRDWHNDLQQSNGLSVPLMKETDYCPILKPPSFGDMLEVMERMKSGKAPGLDNLYLEMIKASPTLSKEIHKFIQHAYLTNELPSAWQTTVTHPIPKISNPKVVNDYRKITLCSVGYKLYVNLLQEHINNFLPRIDDYQAGFLPNRSCDDQLYILKRVLEERWNHGLTTYIFSLDLQKAFDRVNIHELPQILAEHGVPSYLINRVIKSCLHESNCVSWMGQKTTFVNKTVGVKQGCPLSPKLFNIILDRAVMELKESLRLQHIQLFLGEKEENLHVPMLLAYADDITILTSNLRDLEQAVTQFIPILSKYGMGLNVSKSGILIKDADNAIQPAHITIQQQNFPVVKSIKFLGMPITADMHRKDSIRSRCLNTIRITKALIPYLKKLKAPIEVIMRLYHVVIVPSLIYGIKAGSMTQAVRRMLMNREIAILKDLASVAYPKPANISISKLLKGRTINRKISVYRIRYFAHVKRRGNNSLLYKAEKFKIQKKRKVGRPLFTFNTSLLHDLRKYNTVCQVDWEDLWPDKSALKKVTALIYHKETMDDDLLGGDSMLYDVDDAEI